MDLTSFTNDAKEEVPLARCNGHATWMEWVGSGS